MTLILSFPPEMESRLRELAAAAGKDVESVVREAVEEKLARGHGTGAGTGSNGTAATLGELVRVMRSFPPADDGWAGAVEEAIRLGNRPLPAEPPWES